MMRAMPSQRPDAVVFDNDGLLLDTESVWTRAEEDIFERHGFEFTSTHKVELIGKSGAMASKLLEGWLEQPGQGVALMAELDELVVAELERGVEAMVGARDLLERLKAQGTPIGLVSNSPLIFVRRSLEIVGFESIFDIVISAHEVAEPKPAPDPYLEACKRLGVEPGPNVIALEDSPTGVAAARAAGLTVIGVPSVEGVELEEAHHIAAYAIGRDRHRPDARLRPCLTLTSRVRSRPLSLSVSRLLQRVCGAGCRFRGSGRRSAPRRPRVAGKASGPAARVVRRRPPRAG